MTNSEYSRCAADPVYFISRYVTVNNPTSEQWGPLLLNSFQEEMVRAYDSNKYVIGRYPRQTGKTSVALAFFIHQMIFNPGIDLGWFACRNNMAQMESQTARDMVGALPSWLGAVMTTASRERIVLGNGSTLKFATASTDSALRGHRYSIGFCSELQCVKPQEAAHFVGTVQNVMPSCRLLIGGTFFPHAPYLGQLWQDAMDNKNEWCGLPSIAEDWKLSTMLELAPPEYKTDYVPGVWRS